MADNPFYIIVTNAHLWTALAAMVVAQTIKVIIDYLRTKSWHTALFLSTGGMPSSHSALATSLMVSVGLVEGFGTPLFAVCAVVALVVMHDAAGIRRAAGKQAQAINYLFSKLEDQGIILDKKLKELLGHHPIEVFAGALLGILIAILINVFFGSNR